MKKSRSRQPRTKTLFFKQMRKAKPKKRLILPDPVFNDQKVSKFVNHLMYDGKKNTSYEIFYAALETVKAKLPNEEKSALEIWKKALDNVTPQVEVKMLLKEKRTGAFGIRKNRKIPRYIFRAEWM